MDFWCGWRGDGSQLEGITRNKKKDKRRSGNEAREAEERCKRRRRGVAERAEGNPPP